MGTLENKFSWSNSRASTFRRCLRSYWWQYYGAWGGWDRQAPAEARQAYMLKNLTSRWAWVGSAVHEWIERILRRLKEQAEHGQLRFDADTLDVNREVETLTEHMRQQYRQSMKGAYRDNPKRNFGLMEHEYEDPVDREGWRRISDKARTALRGWLGSDVLAEIKASDPRQWFAIEHLDQFEIDDVGIWAVPDFARHLEGGGAALYDWKTGKVEPEGSRLQMACYSIYMHLKHGIEPGTLTSHLVYLKDDVEVHDYTFTMAELEEARNEIRRSMDEMRSRLRDREANEADRHDFPMTDDTSKCRFCVYRRLCGR